jgi:hypothetical protein
MRTKSLTSEQMEARVARFNKLQTYQRQNFEAHNIPPGALEKVAAPRVYPVMAPADYQGRSAGAPVKGPRGLIVSIAECEPGNARPAPTSQYGRELFLPLGPFRDRLGRSGRAHARTRAT